jgi:hypothetical protein
MLSKNPIFKSSIEKLQLKKTTKKAQQKLQQVVQKIQKSHHRIPTVPIKKFTYSLFIVLDKRAFLNMYIHLYFMFLYFCVFLKITIFICKTRRKGTRQQEIFFFYFSC